MTTAHVTNIAHLIDLAPYAGCRIDDYDMTEVTNDFLEQIRSALPAGVIVCANGNVFANIEIIDEIRAVDWTALIRNIKVFPIFARHDVTKGFREVLSPSGLGTIITEAYDKNGSLTVVFGPNDIDDDGYAVEVVSDDDWSATQWAEGFSTQTVNGTRTEIEALARNWLKG
jgi:hypothetical protein